jgi:hypothetical protein
MVESRTLGKASLNWIETYGADFQRLLGVSSGVGVRSLSDAATLQRLTKPEDYCMEVVG